MVTEARFVFWASLVTMTTSSSPAFKLPSGYLLVDASSAGNIKPIQVVEALFAENGDPLPENALMVNREETYLRSDAGELLPLDAIGYDSEEAYKAASGDSE